MEYSSLEIIIPYYVTLINENWNKVNLIIIIKNFPILIFHLKHWGDV